MNVSTEIYHYNSWRNDEEKEAERLVTVIFIIAIFSIFILTIAGAILIGFLKVSSEFIVVIEVIIGTFINRFRKHAVFR